MSGRRRASVVTIVLGMLAAWCVPAVAEPSPAAAQEEPPGLTFPAPVVTELPTRRGDQDAVEMIAHADLDGDGIEDLVVFRHDRATAAPYASVVAMLGVGDGTFTPSYEQPVPDPQFAGGVIVGEFTGDDHLDLVSVSDTAAEVLVHPGVGDGSFGATVAVPVAAPSGSARPGPERLRSGDLDGDGTTDLIVMYTTGLVVLHGDGEGGFAATELPIDVGTLRDAVLVDLTTGDGLDRPDLVLAGSTAVQALTQDAEGGFDESARITGNYQGVVGGRFTDDDHLDVVVSRPDPGGSGRFASVAVLAGDGAGGLSAPVEEAWIETPGTGYRNGDDHLAGDVDGDGHDDAVFGTVGVNVVVAFGDGDGGLEVGSWLGSAPEADIGQRNPQQVRNVVATDVDGDGHVDLVGGTHRNGRFGSINVLLADPDRSRAWSAARVYELAGGSESHLMLDVADFDGDGHLDVVTYDGVFQSNDGAMVVPGRGDGTFDRGYWALDRTPGGGDAVERLWCFEGWPTRVGDFDGDGNADLVCQAEEPSLGFGDGQGGLRSSMRIGMYEDPDAEWRLTDDILPVDLDADGADELVVVADRWQDEPRVETTRVQAFRYDTEAEAWTVEAEHDLGGRDGIFENRINIGLTRGDYDEDGRVDVALLFDPADGSTLERVVFPGDGEGGLAAPTRAATTLPFSTSLASETGDVDGDGHLDIVSVTTVADGRGVVVERGRGDGTFEPAETFPTTENEDWYVGMDLADVNGDGALDVVVETDTTIEVHLGDGAGSFAEPVHLQGDAGASVRAVDVDGDGRPDIISDAGDGVAVHLSGGDAVDPPPVPDPDLTVASIGIPTTVEAGNVGPIAYSVRNEGGAVTGSWVDRIYLSDDEVWDPDDRLLTEVAVSATLAEGDTYARTLQTPIVPHLPGDTHVVVRTDVLGQVAESDETNNLAVTETTMDVEVPALVPGEDEVVDVSAGQLVYRRLDPADGEAGQLVTVSPDVVELVAGEGRLPTLEDHDVAPTGPSSDPRELLLPGGDQPRYLLLSGREEAGEATAVTLSARDLGFDVVSISPSAGSNVGRATVTVRGAGFDPAADVVLIGEEDERSADDVQHVDDGTLHAGFDLTGLPAGEYGLRVDNPDASSNTVPFVVTDGPGGELSIGLSAPGISRTGWLLTATISYRNTGGTDLPAPLLSIRAPDIRLRLPGAERYVHGSQQVVGTVPGGPPGVLPAGAEGSIDVRYVLGSETAELGLVAYEADDTTTVDWPELLERHRRGASDDAWSAILSTFTGEVGATVGEYVEAARRATVEAAGHGVDPNMRGGIVAYLLGRARAHAPGAPVSGTLALRTDEGSTPLAGTSVSVTDEGPGGTAVTFHDGSFNIWDVPTGRYQVAVDDHLLPEPLEVTVPGSATGLDLEVTTGASLTGSVQGPSGAAADVTVTARDLGAEVEHVATTDEDGAYEIGGLSAGTALVGVLAPSLVDVPTVEVAIDATSGGTRDFALVAGGAIAGTLTLPASLEEADPEATVRAVPFHPDGEAYVRRSGGSAVVDPETGAFDIRGLAPGAYRLVASAAGAAPASFPLDPGDHLEVADGATTSGVELTLDVERTVSGRVVDAAGEPVEGARITSDRAGASLAPVRSAPDGTFTLPGQPHGPVTVWAARAGFQTARADVDLAAGDVEDLVLGLGRGGRIDVTVTDVAGAPVPEADVHLFGERSQQVARTIDDGSAVFADLADGDYVVTVSSPAAPSLVARRTVTVTDGAVAVVPVELTGGRLRGTLRGTDGAASAGTVEVVRDGASIDRVEVDDDGTFELTLLDDAEVDLVGVGADVGFARLEGLSAGAGTLVDGLDLQPSDGTDLTVEVSSDAAPVGGATVSLLSDDEDVAPVGSGVFATTTDAGEATFVDVPPGDYTLWVREAGFAASRQPIAVGSEDRTIEVALTDATTIGGTVTGPDDQPLALALVSAVDPATGEAFLAVTGDDGAYELDLLPPSSYDLWVTHGDGAAVHLAAVDSSGSPTDAHVALPAEGRAVHGRVVDPAGIPVVGAWVEAVDGAGRTIATAGTGTDGGFWLRDLPDGDVDVLVDAQGRGSVLTSDVATEAPWDPTDGSRTPTLTVEVGDPIAFLTAGQPVSTSPARSASPTVSALSTMFTVMEARADVPTALLDIFDPNISGVPPPTRHDSDTVEFRTEVFDYYDIPNSECPGISELRSKALGTKQAMEGYFAGWQSAYEGVRGMSDNEIAIATAETIKLGAESATTLLSASSKIKSANALLHKLGKGGMLTDGQLDAAQFVFEQVTGNLIPAAADAYYNGDFKAGDAIIKGGMAFLEGSLKDGVGDAIVGLSELPLGSSGDGAATFAKNLGSLGEAAPLIYDVVKMIKDFYDQNQKVRAAFEKAHENWNIYENAQDNYQHAMEAYDDLLAQLQQLAAECATSDKKRDEEGGGGGGGGDGDDPPPNPPEPPPCDDCDKKQAETEAVESVDPNDIIGPGGYDDPSTTDVVENWIDSATRLGYMIRFENDPEEATAPAIDVVVTHVLDGNLDLSSFEVGDVGWGEVVVDVPPGLQTYDRTVGQDTGDDCDPDGDTYCVRIEVDLDAPSRTVTWRWSTLDAATGAAPTDPFAGFLPPNDEAPEGEGFALYKVDAAEDVGDGDRIEAEASIVFDTNDPIETPVWTNTLDLTRPWSAVDVLPAEVTSPFDVRWSGEDAGAGVASYDVYVSEDGGPLEPWLTGTEETSATFAGELGRTYGFAVQAVDHVGRRQAGPVEVSAVTTVTELDGSDDDGTDDDGVDDGSDDDGSDDDGVDDGSDDGSDDGGSDDDGADDDGSDDGSDDDGSDDDGADDDGSDDGSDDDGSDDGGSDDDGSDDDGSDDDGVDDDGSDDDGSDDDGSDDDGSDDDGSDDDGSDDGTDDDGTDDGGIDDGVSPPRCADATPRGFPDVRSGSTHGGAVACAAGLGLVEGYRDGTFGPGGSLTRGQLASIVDRALRASSVQLPAPASSFGDLEGSVHREAIERLAAAGILRGRTATSFEPLSPVTRAQVTTILDRASTTFLAAYPAADGPRFVDTVGPPHQGAVDRLSAADIVRGLGPDGVRFGPAQAIRRDQTASLVTRWLTDQAERVS